jgi:hypothetical protein
VDRQSNLQNGAYHALSLGAHCVSKYSTRSVAAHHDARLEASCHLLE